MSYRLPKSGLSLSLVSQVAPAKQEHFGSIEVSSARLPFEARTANAIGYAIFWNAGQRARFRAALYRRLLQARPLIWRTSTKSTAGPQGGRVLEHRTKLFGVPVSIQRHEVKQYRVGLLVDEFFGGWDTAIGGYGALARKYICKFIPDTQMKIDVLLNAGAGDCVQKIVVEGTTLYKLPSHPLERQEWLDRQSYDLFMTIEMTQPSFEIIRSYRSKTPLLYWIQDPRDLSVYQPRLRTVQRLKEDDWEYTREVAKWLEIQTRLKRITFISQGTSLVSTAKRIYRIPESLPIDVISNPVENIDGSLENRVHKKNRAIFLGRLEAVKRVWIFCEIAKAMPHYEFVILGETGKGRDEVGNAKSLERYRRPDGSSKLPNLTFAGHLDGDKKYEWIRTSKLLVNTSIWEAIPVSWLEALSCGTLVVAAVDCDAIAARFGTFVGEVLGDGDDPSALRRFCDAIEYWMTHEPERAAKAEAAIQYIGSNHSIEKFVRELRGTILGIVRPDSDRSHQQEQASTSPRRGGSAREG
jgi:glycosyltransferase involved in cell wall biosynthesis